MCFGCGYMYADVDETGAPISLEYCHCFESYDCCPVEYEEYLEWSREEQ